MKPVLLSIVFAASIATGAVAQDRANQDQVDQDRANSAANSIPPVQAPPALDDPAGPGAVALPTPQAQAQSAVAADQTAPVKPMESPGLPADVQAAANAAELPVVTVRQQGTDTVEEYRKHGKLVFVRVLSDRGPARYYVDNPANVPSGVRELSGPSGVVQPVYYKLFEWK